MKKLLTCVFIVISLVRLSAQDVKEDFKPYGKFYSQVFGDYYYVAQADTGVAGLSNAALNKKLNTNAFKFRRVNLAYEHFFTEKISALVRFEADETSIYSDGRTGVYPKDASLKWSICKLTDIVIGLQSTISFEVTEKYWGLRWIEKPLMDLRGVAASRDLGLSVRGKFMESGKLFYNLMVANNSNLKPESDRFKRVYVNIGYKPLKEMDVVLYCDNNFKQAVNKKNKDEMLAGLFVGYKNEKLAAGIDGFYKQTNNGWASFDDPTVIYDLGTFGASIFGSFKFGKKYGAFARYDLFDNNMDSKMTGDSRNFATLGFIYSPAPQISFSPNVEIETYEKTGTRTPTPSVWPRITFHWQLK